MQSNPRDSRRPLLWTVVDALAPDRRDAFMRLRIDLHNECESAFSSNAAPDRIEGERSATSGQPDVEHAGAPANSKLERWLSSTFARRQAAKLLVQAELPELWSQLITLTQAEFSRAIRAIGETTTALAFVRESPSQVVRNLTLLGAHAAQSAADRVIGLRNSDIDPQLIHAAKRLWLSWVGAQRRQFLLRALGEAVVGALAGSLTARQRNLIRTASPCSLLSMLRHVSQSQAALNGDQAAFIVRSALLESGHTGIQSMTQAVLQEC